MEIKLNIQSIIEKCNANELSEFSCSFDISIDDFKKNGRSLNYNALIRKNTKKFNKIHGVYVISHTDLNEILYVGMSGKIKRLENGGYDNCGYDIRKRLISARDKTKDGKYVTSSVYFQEKMIDKHINSITITIISTKKFVSPTYLESQILQWIYSDTKSLPDWNKSF